MIFLSTEAARALWDSPAACAGLISECSYSSGNCSRKAVYLGSCAIHLHLNNVHLNLVNVALEFCIHFCIIRKVSVSVYTVHADIKFL